MTEPVKKPKAKRATRAKAPKAAPVKPKKASAPSRSKKSSPSKTEVDGATQVAVLVQEIESLKTEVGNLRSEVNALRRQVPMSVFETFNKMTQVMLDAYESSWKVKEAGVEGEPINGDTHTLFVGETSFIVGQVVDGRVKVILDSNESRPSKLRTAFQTFIDEHKLEADQEVLVNLYEVH